MMERAAIVDSKLFLPLAALSHPAMPPRKETPASLAKVAAAASQAQAAAAASQAQPSAPAAQSQPAAPAANSQPSAPSSHSEPAAAAAHSEPAAAGSKGEVETGTSNKKVDATTTEAPIEATSVEVTKRDQQDFTTRLAKSPHPEQQSLLSYYKELPRMSAEKASLIQAWKKDKSASWFEQYLVSKGVTKKETAQGLEGFATECSWGTHTQTNFRVSFPECSGRVGHSRS